jgi:DNA invertase Pin-like site-specific DNA recombinase
MGTFSDSPATAPFRVVTYARVSTIRQESEGQSLVTQERAFEKYMKRTSAVRIAAYAESKSAKSIEGRREFLRLIEDLPNLQPDLILVDTIDRFSRNLNDGLNLLERFRGLVVRLLPLDWDEPVDLDDDRDWKNVVQELTAADYERRRIRSRVNRAFASRRERGATLHNRGPFGLVKQRDRLVPHPQYAPIIQRAERMFVRGVPVEKILHMVQAVCGPAAWKTRAGLVNCLENYEYVRAGVRTIHMQERINARLATGRARFGQRHSYVHPMTGVFACGICVEMGADPNRALICGGYTPDDTRPWNARVHCQRRHGRHPNNIGVNEFVLDLVFRTILKELLQRDALDWSRLQMPDSIEEAIADDDLAQRLQTLERTQRSHAREISRLLDLLPETNAIVRGTKARIKDVRARDAWLSQSRQEILDKFQASKGTARSVAGVSARASLEKALRDWSELDNHRKQEVARSICACAGSHPRAFRNGIGFPHQVIVIWYEVVGDVVWRVRYGKGIQQQVEVLPRVGCE